MGKGNALRKEPRERTVIVPESFNKHCSCAIRPSTLDDLDYIVENGEWESRNSLINHIFEGYVNSYFKPKKGENMKPTERIKLDLNKVRSCAKELEISLTKLSKSCGHTDSWVYNACATDMPLSTAELIASVLGVSVDDLEEKESDEPAETELEETNVPEVSDAENLKIALENISGTIERVVDEINNLNLIIASRGYRIAEALEAISKGINEPWTDAEEQ